jgi:hypothetical protein
MVLEKLSVFILHHSGFIFALVAFPEVSCTPRIINPSDLSRVTTVCL